MIPLTEERTANSLHPQDYKEPQRLDLSINLTTSQVVALPASLHHVPPLTQQVTQSAAEAMGDRFSLRQWISRLWKREWVAKLRKAAPWLISGTILGINLWIQSPTFVVGAMVAALVVRVLKAIIRSSPLCQKVWQKLLDQAGIKEEKLALLTAAFAGGSWLSISSPSNAILFDRAQTYVASLFTTAAGAGATTSVTPLVPLIFGTLRVIFVIYIGVALIRCINSFRNEEDWTTAARIPVVVVLCVVIGDALTNLIVPAAA